MNKKYTQAKLCLFKQLFNKKKKELSLTLIYKTTEDTMRPDIIRNFNL